MFIFRRRSKSTGTIRDWSGVGERGLKLQAMLQPMQKNHLECMVAGVELCTVRGKSRIPAEGAKWIRKKSAIRNTCVGRQLIGVQGTKKMRTLRANIRNRE